MQPHPLVLERKLGALRHALGEHVLDALSDPAVVEILVNPDGRLILDRIGEGRRDTGEIISPEARERTVRLIGDHVGEPVGPNSPRLSGVLPTGERFQGVLAPISRQPAYAIRKRPALIFGLDHYVAAGAMNPAQAHALREAGRQRCNIVISGGAGSGKTTLANAILAEPAYAQDRIILIEDTPELQCSSWDVLALLTRRPPQPVSVGDLVRDALRLRPDRIVVGELREGAAALETLKAWNTGHPGGLATLHANSATEAVSRLEDLLGEVLASPTTALATQSIDRIVHIARTPDGRQVEEILAVTNTGRHRAAELTQLA